MSKNYIYFQTSDKAAQVGDLTETGIINRVEFPRIYTTDQLYESLVPNRIIPLLIMDAPEGLIGDNVEVLKDFMEVHDKVMEKVIPFHSNEQVYNWLKSKGIKPEADLLIEFDGEVEIKYMIAYDDSVGNPTRWTEYTEFSYNKCIGPHKRKVAIIKEPEVKQEGEEEVLNNLTRNFNSMESHIYREAWNACKQHFKIERRE